MSGVIGAISTRRRTHHEENCCDDRDRCPVSMQVLAAGQGGYTGPSATTPASSTTQAADLPARAARSPPSPMSNRCGTIRVTLRGKITERVSDDLYKFRDATGVINVDIDHKRWNGVTVGPQDTVEIQGKSIRTGTRWRSTLNRSVKSRHKSPADKRKIGQESLSSLCQSMSRGGDDERY